MKKNIIGFIGFALVIGTVFSGLDRFVSLLNWSTAEIIGYNMSTIIFLAGGAWMIKYSIKKDTNPNSISAKNSQEPEG